MKLWRFRDPRDYTFASVGSRGAWSALVDGRSKRIQPIILEWQPGSDIVGDFTWPLFGVVVKKTVGEELIKRFNGFVLGPVEMIQDPKLKRPKTERGKKRIWLPYEGPPLKELWTTAYTIPDVKRSSIEIVVNQEGRKTEVFDGIEHEVMIWDSQKLKGHWKHFPRIPGKGIYISKEKLNGADIFKTDMIDWIFCTNDVKLFIESCKFSNISFYEVGELF